MIVVGRKATREIERRGRWEEYVWRRREGVESGVGGRDAVKG